MTRSSGVKAGRVFVTGKHTEGKLFSCLLPHLPAKTCVSVSNANEYMKGCCGHLQPAAKKLSQTKKNQSTVEEQQCVSSNPFPLQSCNTECSFNQPPSALCGCQEPTWPNSKLIHFSIDLFDNNREKFSLLAYSLSRAAPGEGRSLSPLPQVMAATSCCNTLRWLSVELALRLLSTANPRSSE